ncbi:MAG TPA: penicillin acylase family protein [Candidatus Hydrogenedentes bacterium]|nr:penicillin acylase family protein [Candidatus Hydrogenedentota bacterium]
MRIVKFLFRLVWKLFTWGFLVIVLAVLGVAGYLYALAPRTVPNLDATVRSPLLKAEVRVVRDYWGVPHILAQHEADAYYALGYCMAQDRLFQMEVMRRLARGELAELLGPPVVRVDRIMRAFRLRAKAEEYLDTEAKTLPAPLNEAMNAFVAGVNDFIQDGPLPLEFTMLQIPSRPFTKVDCLAVAAILPITFADGIRQDPLGSVLKQRHPDKDMDALFPGYKYDAVTVMENIDEARAIIEQRLGGEAGAAQAVAAFDALRDWIGGLQLVSDHYGPQMGSNSWVLAPSRTKSGKAILANDPHIGFTNPSIWYEAHLKFGDFENYGYYLAPVPLALLGHNEDRGWGMTMFANDDVDMYIETFHPADPLKVRHRGEWVDVRVERERIGVRFGRDVTCEVRITPHGPVVTDLLRELNHYDGPPVSLRWVWQNVPYTDILAVYQMGYARDLESFGQAVALITSPGINISYADKEGNIAWWAAGLLPIRPDHVNPKALLDGASGRDEIGPDDYLPRAHNPHLINPEWGFIVTANNMSTLKPLGESPKVIPELQGYWQPADRAGRIVELLSPRHDWTIEDLKAVQMDDTAWAAPKIVPVLTRELRAREDLLSERQREALALLEAWDYRHNIESQGAVIYEILWSLTLKHAIEDELGPENLATYMTVADHWNFFKHFIHDEASPFWDDIATPDIIETRSDILLRALKETQAELDARIGPDAARWTWGALHTMEFKHPFGYLPLFDRIFNIGPFPSPGAAQVINNMLYRRGTDFDVLAGPSTRRLIDFADPAHSLTVLPTGNSGHVLSKQYDNQAEMFVRGEYRVALYLWNEIEAAKEHEMRFLPR